MTDSTSLRTPIRTAPGERPRGRHWRQWGLGAALLLAVLLVAAVGAYVGTSTEPRLALPAVASPPVGPLSGTWSVGSGSEAGFRVRQTVLGMSGDVVGRTDSVTGSAVFADDRVTSARFQVDLTTITANGKASPQFEESLDTAAYPAATVTLTQPLAFGPAFASGALATTTVQAELGMDGTQRDVTLTISARRDGSALEAVGSTPIAFSDWGIKGPTGYGFLGSLADRGEAEFLLVLHQP